MRGELVASASILRRRLSPSVLIRGARTRLSVDVSDAMSSLGRKRWDIGLVLSGLSLGVLLNKAFGPAAPTPSIANDDASDARTLRAAPARSSMFETFRTTVLAAVGLGAGYYAGHFAPRSKIEEEIAGELSRDLGGRLSQFLQANADGMKSSAAHMFGFSKVAAALLMGLALVGEQLKPRTP